jgi:hypothetical protein
VGGPEVRGRRRLELHPGRHAVLGQGGPALDREDAPVGRDPQARPEPGHPERTVPGGGVEVQVDDLVDVRQALGGKAGESSRIRRCDERSDRAGVVDGELDLDLEG